MLTSHNSARSKRWLILAIGLGAWMITFNISSVNIALPTLIEALGAAFATTQWVALSYSLTMTVLVLGVARLADMYSKKQLYLTGIGLFTFSAFLCGSALSVNWLVGFRFLQGLGAVLMTTSGIAIIAETFPVEQRGRALGVIISFTSLGIAIGPLIGGSLIGWGSWRLIFWMNVPIGLITIGLIRQVVPLRQSRQVTRQFDGLGTLIWIMTIGCLTLGMSQIQRWGLVDPRTLCLFITAVISFGLFLRFEARLNQPMLDLRIFEDWPISLSLLSHALAFMVISGSALILPFFLEFVKNYPPQQAGLLVATSPLSAGLISPVAGVLSDRYSPRLVTLAGFISLTLGCLLVSTFDAQITVLDYLICYVPFGLGIGLFQSPNSSVIVSRVSRLRVGIASGLLTLSRTLGQTIGISLMGLLFAISIPSGNHGTSPEQISLLPPDTLISAFQNIFRVEATIMVCAAIATGLAWAMEESKV